jgi:hypothetical protein
MEKHLGVLFTTDAICASNFFLDFFLGQEKNPFTMAVKKKIIECLGTMASTRARRQKDFESQKKRKSGKPNTKDK